MKLTGGVNGHGVQDGNGWSQNLPSPGNYSWLPEMLGAFKSIEEVHLATTGGIPRLGVCPQHLPPELCSLLWSMYHCLAQCTPKVAGYLLLTISCLSDICTLIYSVLIRIQELKNQ